MPIYRHIDIYSLCILILKIDRNFRLPLYCYFKMYVLSKFTLMKETNLIPLEIYKIKKQLF